MKIENRQQLLVVLVGVAFALLVGVNFVLEPLGNWWSARQKQIQQLRVKIADGQKLIKRETGIRSHWSDMQTNALPANASAAEQRFLMALDGWSRNAGVELTSITPQWKNESTNYLTLACRVEAAGDLGTLSRFVHELEQGPMALKLDTLELGARDKDGQQLNLSTEINGLALKPTDDHKETK